MSYCRWSSDNFKCDIYAYESQFGFEIHVASHRYRGNIPEEIFPDDINNEKQIEVWKKSYRKRSEYLKTCGSESIGLSCDGESFTCDNIESFRDKMIELREIGYRFPDYVLTDIDNEIEDSI